MKTAVPLQRVTRLCAADLLSLLGSTATEGLGVETLDLPSRRTSLDTLLRLRGADGRPSLHLVAWLWQMDTDVLSYVFQDNVAEWEREKVEWEQQKAVLETQIQAIQEREHAIAQTAHETATKTAHDAMVKAAHQAIEDVLMARFPDTPLTVVRDIRQITDLNRLWALIGPLAGAATDADARRVLADAAAANGAAQQTP